MLGVCALVLLLAVGGVVTWRVLGGDSYVVQGASPPTAAQARPGDAAKVLAELVTALQDRDAAAATALGDDDAGDLLASVTANAQALDVVGLDLRYVDEVGAVAEDGSWEAAVDATWR